MKRIIAVAAAFAAIVSCAPKNAPVLSGHIDGLKSDMLMLVYGSAGDSGVSTLDTLRLVDGNFSWSPSVDEPGIVMIVEPGNFVDNLSIYAVPGEHAEICGTMTDYTVSGSRFYKDWNKSLEYHAPINAERRALIRTIPEDGADEDYDMAEFSRKDREIGAKWNAAALEFIKANPGSDVSAYLAREISKADTFLEANEIISDKVKKGKLGFMIEERLLMIGGESARQAAMGKIHVGVEAPDFSLKTSTGETFTLSDYRGGYVMLDFWGTWCGWCVEGLPTVKEIAHTYADRLTVVSVDTNDPEGAWRKGIKKFGMDWVQVYNSREDAIDSKYAVEGFPGFYLIDPDGIIVMMEFGEPAHFVEKIGELISK